MTEAKPTESEGPENTTPPPVEPEDTAPKQPVKKTRQPRQQKQTTTVKDLTADDLVDQETGFPKPLSAQTENLSATVSGDLGRVLVKLSVRGYIGEEPVVVRGQDIDEFAELLAALDKAAEAQLKENAKKAGK